VPVVVHGERGNAIAWLYAETFEGLAHAPRLAGKLLPVGAVGASVSARANDLAAMMLTLRVIHQPHDSQRKVLHRAKAHARLP
jgi:hypothetical protein